MYYLANNVNQRYQRCLSDLDVNGSVVDGGVLIESIVSSLGVGEKKALVVGRFRPAITQRGNGLRTPSKSAN